MKIIPNTFLLLGFMLLMASSPKPPPNTYSLIIEIENCRSSKGKIYFALYRNERGFMKEENAYKLQIFDISLKKNVIILEDLPEGQYAFSCYHDENGNGKLDKNVFGIPREGYGFSNNARGTFGPPSFKQCVFELPRRSSQRIRLSY